MGDEASIRARLGLDVTDWRANSKTAGEDVTKFTAKVTEGKAAIAAFEAKMREAGKATADQKKLLSDARSELVKYEQDLRKATEAKKRFDAADNLRSPSPVPPRPSPTVPGHGGHGAGGNDRMRGAELGHSARSVMDMLSAGQSPVQATMMEVPRLLQAFGGGLGTIVGVGALAGIAEKLVEARNEAKELRKALDALGAPMPAAGKASIEEINERLKQTIDTSQKLEAAKSGFFHVLAGALANRLKNPMGNIVEAVAAQGETDDANARGAEGEKDRLTHSLAMSEKAGIDLDKRTANGDDSAAFDKIRLKATQERQAIEERITKGELSRDTELVANSHEREKLEIEIEQRRQTGAKETLALESQLLQIKRTGADVEVKSAEARLSAARQTLFNGPREGIEHAGNYGKVQEAEEALRIAQRTNEEHRDDLDIQEAVALVVKNSDARHLVALGMEEQKLRARLASPEYGDDEKRTMSAHLADVQNEHEDAMRAHVARATQGWLAQQAATYAPGQAGQLQALKDRRFALGFERDANTKGTDADGNPVYKNGVLAANQDKEDHQLEQAINDLNETMKGHLLELRAQKTATENRGKTPTLDMQNQATNARYDRQAEANRNDPKALKEIEENRKAELIANEADESQMTPAEKLERQRRNDARDRAVAGVKSRQKNHAEVEAANDTSGSFYKAFPGLVKDAPGAPTPDDSFGKQPELPAVEPDTPVPPMYVPEMTMPAPDMPDSNHAGIGAAGSPDVVAAISDLQTAIINACTG